jgi:hypothetical protein
MRANLKGLHSPDAQDLKTYQPADERDFGILVQMMAGPYDGAGLESFDFVLCTPAWLQRKLESQKLIVGHHYIIVNRYDYQELWTFLEKQCLISEGRTWAEVARKLSVVGRWEFDNYSEPPRSP